MLTYCMLAFCMFALILWHVCIDQRFSNALENLCINDILHVDILHAGILHVCIDILHVQHSISDERVKSGVDKSKLIAIVAAIRRGMSRKRRKIALIFY